MKNQRKKTKLSGSPCFELLERLHITPIDPINDAYTENILFWYEDFCDFITIPGKVIEQYDQDNDPAIFRVLIDYSFRRGFTAAKLQYERGLCSTTNPYIQANDLVNS